MTPNNEESFHELGWVLDNADRGFYLYTASHPMQHRVAEYFTNYNIAIYDYSQNPAPYSFRTLAEWARAQQSKIFFIINMQVALQSENDIITLNMSRDLLTKFDAIWVFGMDWSTDVKVSKIAFDIYSFIRIRANFEDEGVEKQSTMPLKTDSSDSGYYQSYADAKAQMDRYEAMRDELMGLPLDSEPERLLMAAITLNTIAELYSKYARYDEALVMFIRILEIREKLLGCEHEDTADTYNNIGRVYRLLGNYSQAFKYCDNAVAINENILTTKVAEAAKRGQKPENELGRERLNVAKAYSNIAGVYDDKGDYSKALEYRKKALAIREAVLGVNHPDTAISYHNIATVYDAMRDYPKALEYYEKALAIREKVLSNDPDTASSYNGIAVVYAEQGEYIKALEYLNNALIIQEKVLGVNNPDTAASYNNIADVYSAQGDYPKALELYKKSYNIFLKVLGINHQYTQIVKESMEATQKAMPPIG